MVLIKYFGMYMIMGTIAIIVNAIAFAIYMVHNGLEVDEPDGKKCLDIISDIPDAYNLVQQKMQTDEGRKDAFKNIVFNTVTWPTTLITLWMRVPEMKKYVDSVKKP